jgi:hypothetical protein
MKDFDKLVAEIMADAEKDGEPVTREEAEEMAKMELGAKDVSRDAKAVTAPKERKPRPVKVSDEKKELFDTIVANLTRAIGVERENITIVTPNKLIEVKIGEKTFKIDLIERRPPKNH